MNMDIITFRSITPAQRAQRVLRQGGVESTLQRTPRHIQRLGCGYSLRIRSSNREKTKKLLDQAAISYQYFDAEELAKKVSQ